MAFLISGIVVFGVLIISVVIYFLSVAGWSVYRNRILSSPPTSNELVKKIDCIIDWRLKPDLITFNYKKENDDQNHEEASNCETSTTQCVVCLRGLENEELVRQLPKCKHTFHAPCIDTWLNSHSGCPLCRTLIDRLASDDNNVGLTTPHVQEKNSQEAVTVVDNIRTSVLSISII